MAVGATAAVVHWSVAVGVASAFALAPLLANVLGWVVAFSVSFAGQSLLTFRDQQAPATRAARRFALLSFSGFVVNESAYAAVLRFSPWRYDLLLGLVLVGVAVVTYLVSRHWAFRGS